MDGDADSTDRSQLQTWNGDTTKVRGDVNLDGVVDGTDVTDFDNGPSGETLGRLAISRTDVTQPKRIRRVRKRR